MNFDKKNNVGTIVCLLVFVKYLPSVDENQSFG